MSRVVKIWKKGATTVVESKTDGVAKEVYFFNEETDFIVGNGALRVCHSSGAKITVSWAEIENKLTQANLDDYLAHIISDAVGFFNPNITVTGVIE